MRKSRPFYPVVGEVYKNRNGFRYRCIDSGQGYYTFISSVGWVFHVKDVSIYDDNCIDWAYSYGGYFDSVFRWK